jgi:hypothetical protein
MADLLKAGARKPRILKGVCYTGNNYDSNEAHEPGVMPGMCYELTVDGSDARYTARLTEVEMLHTIQEWLTKFNAHQAHQRRKNVERKS